MKTFLKLLIILIIIFAPEIVFAQQVVELTQEFSWSVKEAEDDVKGYQLYMSDKEDMSDAVAVGDFIKFNPLNNPENLETIKGSATWEIPTGETVTRHFAVRAIDTSDNESGNSNVILAGGDSESPDAPQDFKTTIEVTVIIKTN